MTGYDWSWLAWAAVTLVWFFALEIPAVRNTRKGDTLSEEFWKLSRRRAFRLGAVLVFTWLVLHLFTGGWI